VDDVSDEPSQLESLPETMIRSDVRVASEYGLKSAAAIRAKQDEISAAREIRIRRIVTHLEAGWVESDAITFAAAKDEWFTARRMCRAGKKQALELAPVGADDMPW